MVRRVACASLCLVALIGLVVGISCYTTFEPACGFLCGPGSACPTDYTCSAADNVCHRNGAPDDLVCRYDAAVNDAPIDAKPDAPVDAKPDAPIDARPDAPIDAPPDAPIDAPIDAPADAPPDA